MADQSWPISIPQTPIPDGFQDGIQELSIRSKMDVGPDKIRRRYTAGIRKLQMQFHMNGTQKSDFRAFYITTLLGGSLAFDFEDPAEGGTIELRFVTPPNIEYIGGDYWLIKCDCEKLP